MDRLFDLFRYNKDVDYERELNSSSRTIGRCDRVVHEIIRDYYSKLVNKRFDIASSYIIEFGEDLSCQVKSAAEGGWSFVKADKSLTDVQKREFLSWAKDYFKIVKNTISREIDALLKRIAYYPGDRSKNCLYYNFWGDKFLFFCQESYNALGATDEQRASFDVEYNVQLFTAKYEELRNSQDSACMYVQMLPKKDYSEVIQNSKPFFQEIFNDYIKRLSKEEKDIDKIENYGLGWLFFTKRFCDESDSKAFIKKDFTDNVVSPILSEMQTNFLRDTERKRTSKITVVAKEIDGKEGDIFEKLESNRDNAIRRKVEEASALKTDATGTDLKRGRIFFNLWGKEYYRYAAPLFKLNPIPDDKKLLIDRVSNAKYFSKKLATKLMKYDGSIGIEKDKNVAECSEDVLLLLTDYMKYVDTKSGLYADDYVSEGIIWNKAAEVAIKDAIDVVLSQSQSGDETQYRDMINISTSLISKLQGCFTQLAVSHNKFFGWDFEYQVPYNMVGDSFEGRVKDISGKYILSPVESRLVSYVHNSETFLGFFLEILAEIRQKGITGDNYSDLIEEYCELLRDIGQNYIDRLSVITLADPRGYLAQTQLWVWLTRSLILSNIEHELSLLKHWKAAGNVYNLKSEEEATKATSVLVEFKSCLANVINEIEKGMDKFVYERLCKLIKQVRTAKMKQEDCSQNKQEEDTVVSKKGISYAETLSDTQVTVLQRRLLQELLSNPGYKGLVYIKAAQLLNYIAEPSYPDLMASFPKITTKERNFSAFLGSTGKFVENISHKNEALLDFATEQLKSLIEKS